MNKNLIAYIFLIFVTFAAIVYQVVSLLGDFHYDPSVPLTVIYMICSFVITTLILLLLEKYDFTFTTGFVVLALWVPLNFIVLPANSYEAGIGTYIKVVYIVFDFALLMVAAVIEDKFAQLLFNLPSQE